MPPDLTPTPSFDPFAGSAAFDDAEGLSREITSVAVVRTETAATTAFALGGVGVVLVVLVVISALLPLEDYFGNQPLSKADVAAPYPDSAPYYERLGLVGGTAGYVYPPGLASSIPLIPARPSGSLDVALDLGELQQTLSAIEARLQQLMDEDADAYALGGAPTRFGASQ